MSFFTGKKKHTTQNMAPEINKNITNTSLKKNSFWAETNLPSTDPHPNPHKLRNKIRDAFYDCEAITECVAGNVLTCGMINKW